MHLLQNFSLLLHGVLLVLSNIPALELARGRFAVFIVQSLGSLLVIEDFNLGRRVAVSLVIERRRKLTLPIAVSSVFTVTFLIEIER